MAVGELHEEIFYAGTNVGEVPLATYDHTKPAASNGQLRIVNDGSDDAIVLSGALGSTPSSASDFTIDDFIVVEPVEQYPGTGRWQVAIIRTNTNEISYLLAPDGGWSGTDVTPGNNYGFGSNVHTDVLPFINAALPSSGSLRLSSCNLDTYDSGTKRYTYFRIFSKPSGVTAADEALRVGGFIPTNITAETKPIVALSGQPTLYQTSSGRWSITTGIENPSSNACRTPYDFPARVRAMHGGDASAATCAIRGPNYNGYPTDRSNQAIALTVRLVTGFDLHTIGTFGPNDMKSFATDIADYDDDGVPNYFNHQGLLFRWKP